MKKLYRSATDKYVFGILGGLGDYFEVDATVLRLAFVFFVLITGFFPGVLAYLIAFLIVPRNPSDMVHKTTRHHEDAHDHGNHDHHQAPDASL